LRLGVYFALILSQDGEGGGVWDGNQAVMRGLVAERTDGGSGCRGGSKKNQHTRRSRLWTTWATPDPALGVPYAIDVNKNALPAEGHRTRLCLAF